MSNSSLVNYTLISPNKTVKRNHKIDTITIHCMSGQLTAEGCGSVFANSSAKASSNYGIGKDGKIGMYVEEKDRSWCSSNAANDHRAVTIECASDNKHPYAVNDKVYESLIKLCVDICKRNGIQKLIWSDTKSDRVNHKNGCNMTVHRDFANKACPGDYLFNKMGEIADKVNKQLSQSFTPGWNQDSVGWWYVYDNGTYPINTWKKMGAIWYYFDANGYMAHDEFVKSSDYNTNGLLYWVDSEGAWDNKSYKWKSNNKGWWIESVTGGWWAKSEWQKIDGKWYYFDKNGYMVTGKVKIGLKYYYFNSDGSWIEK